MTNQGLLLGRPQDATETQRSAPDFPDAILRCVYCHEAVQRTTDLFECGCGRSYPIIHGVPVLLNESCSVFRVSDYVNQKPQIGIDRPGVLRQLLSVFPTVTLNLSAKRNYDNFFNHLPRPATVLIVGGGAIGEGLAPHVANPEVRFVETDVYFGQRNQIICDGHDLPFADESVDGVIIQAVLEHVLDPPRCVEEIHRVLKPSGLVYAEIPFMQQVHAGKYDFTRYTHLGFRRLFRMFDELDSGMSSGPGSALAWAYQYLLLSFVRGGALRGMMRAFARLTGFWLKYLDLLVKNSPGALDAACGVYFLGTKSDQPLSDRDLLAAYRGASTT